MDEKEMEILEVLGGMDRASLTARQIKKKANGLPHNAEVDASDYPNSLGALNEGGFIERDGSSGPRARWKITRRGMREIGLVCPHCGLELHEGDEYCEGCGLSLKFYAEGGW